MVCGAHQQIAEGLEHRLEIGPIRRCRCGLEQQRRGLKEPITLRFGVFVGDICEEDGDAVGAGVVSFLEPGIEGRVIGFEGGELALLHGPALGAILLLMGAHGWALFDVAVCLLLAVGFFWWAHRSK